MEAFGSIREGVTINIQRSDGRVHQAVVTQLHAASSSVSVEWCERNETKGKEIELEALYALNMSLLAPKNSNGPVSGGRIPVPTNGASNGNAAHVNGANGANGDNGATIHQPTNGVLKRPTNRQTQGPGSVMSNQLQAPQAVPQTSRSTIAPNELYTNGGGGLIGDHAEDRKNSKKPLVGAASALDPGSNFRTADEIRRKSNVVKEIEKIKQNREKRRANQEEKRQKINEIDTSVPAWEFANMIAEFRATLDFTRVTANESVQDLRICVCVRKRPINKKETSKKDIDCLTMPNKDLCLVHLPKLKVDLTKYLDNQKFRFDFAFDEVTPNDLVYK